MDVIMRIIRRLNSQNLSIVPPHQRRRDDALASIIHEDLYSVQTIPGNGDCFFYSIALIYLKHVDHYSLKAPDMLVYDVMCYFRRVVATTIYSTPSLLEIVRVIDQNVGKMQTNKSGKPNKEELLKYYLETHPYADHCDISVIQKLPMFSDTIFVIYNSNDNNIVSFVGDMHILSDAAYIVQQRRRIVHSLAKGLFG